MVLFYTYPIIYTHLVLGDSLICLIRLAVLKSWGSIG